MELIDPETCEESIKVEGVICVETLQVQERLLWLWICIVAVQIRRRSIAGCRRGNDGPRHHVLVGLYFCNFAIILGLVLRIFGCSTVSTLGFFVVVGVLAPMGLSSGEGQRFV